MSAIGSNHSNQAVPEISRRTYVRRRDRLSAADKKLSRRAQRRILNVSPTYWAAEQEDACDFGEKKRRLELLPRYGDFSLAYSAAVQPLLKYHQHSDFDGFIAYRRRWNLTFALGDPVVSTKNKSALMGSFCERYESASFCQVSEPTAEILASRGFYINEMGVDTILDLPTYDFAGKEKEWLRYAANWIQRRSFEVRECSFDDVNEADVEAVSEAWRNTRTVKTREGRFLNRPIVIAAPEPGVRKFYLFDADNRMLAFIFLDPIYRNGQIAGYVTAFKRRHPDAPKYAESAMMKMIIEKLKAEGVAQLNLGLSPAAWLEDNHYKCNWWTSKILKTMFRSRISNQYLYNLAGHADYKRRFRGREVKTYFASASRFNSARLIALVGLCGCA